MNSATVHINYMTPAVALHPNALYFDNGRHRRYRHAPCGHRDGPHHSATHGFELLGWDIGCHDHNHDNYNHRGHTQAEASQVRASFATQLRHFGSDSCCSFRFGLACAGAASVRHVSRSAQRPNKVPTGARPDRSLIAQPAPTRSAQTGHTEMAGFDLQSLKKGIAMLLYVSDNAATCYPSTHRFSTTRSARYTLCTLAVVLAGVLQWHTYSYLQRCFQPFAHLYRTIGRLPLGSSTCSERFRPWYPHT